MGEAVVRDVIPMNAESKERAWKRIFWWIDGNLLGNQESDKCLLKDIEKKKMYIEDTQKAERVSDDDSEQIGPLPTFYTPSQPS